MILTKLVRICWVFVTFTNCCWWTLGLIRKKANLFGTWTHPATKQCSMIDFVTLRSAQRRHCLDVQVMHGATCWTDHKLVRKSKLKFSLCCSCCRSGRRPAPVDVQKLGDPSVQQLFCGKAFKCLEKMDPLLAVLEQHMHGVKSVSAWCQLLQWWQASVDKDNQTA